VLYADDPSRRHAMERAVAGWDTTWTLTFAADGDSALQLLSQDIFDVVVADVRMRVSDQGISLLSAVRDQQPHAARIALSEPSDRGAILRSVGAAHRYLSRPCEPTQLTIAVGEALALRETLHNDSLEAVVSRVQSLPSLPTLYLDIVDELNRPEPRLATITRIVERDLAMSAKLLQLVNSAYFGRPGRTADVQQAVHFLGIDTLQALVLGVHIFTSMHCSARHFSPTNLWRHSVSISALAGAICRFQDADDGVISEAMTAGLLHDCGKLILASSLPTEFDALVIRSRREGAQLYTMEQEAFGCTHAEIGAYLLGLWGLPDPVVAAVAFHHRPSACGSQHFNAVTAVHAANAIRGGGRLSLPPDAAYLEALQLTIQYDEWRHLAIPDR
jgi:HD-like signal output (HDOD) protein